MPDSPPRIGLFDPLPWGHPTPCPRLTWEEFDEMTTQNGPESRQDAPQGAEAPGKAIGDLAQPDAATIEEVARLIWRERNAPIDPAAWDVIGPVVRETYRRVARAVLAWAASRATADKMNRPDLASIRKRATAATPGPLTVDAMYGSAWYTLLAPTIGQIADVFGFSDAHFFAYARTDVPDLLAYCECLEAASAAPTRASQAEQQVVEAALAYQEAADEGDMSRWDRVALLGKVVEAARALRLVRSGQ